MCVHKHTVNGDKPEHAMWELHSEVLIRGYPSSQHPLARLPPLRQCRAIFGPLCTEWCNEERKPVKTEEGSSETFKKTKEEARFIKNKNKGKLRSEQTS